MWMILREAYCTHITIFLTLSFKTQKTVKNKTYIYKYKEEKEDREELYSAHSGEDR